MGLGEALILLVVLGAAVAVVGGGVVLLVLLVRDTARRQGRFGVNVQAVVAKGACPGCGRPLPVLRKPRSLRQALWGGFTCEGCGLELDKWGRPTGAGSQA